MLPPPSPCERSILPMPTENIIFTRQQIAGKVAELGRRISLDYAGRELLVVGVLTGAFIFVADLVRELDLDLEVDFLRVSSYGQATSSSGEISLGKDLDCKIGGREVLLVEDIVDSGRTLAWLRQHLTARRPASLRVCALIDKRERREVEVEIDYLGFRAEKGFLVGYGLDYAGRYRQRSEILELVRS
jgi:hypoxanthine phosphoribosyltransferase